MRKIAVLLLIVTAISARSAKAEHVEERHWSPDKAYEVRVERTSEAPDLGVSLHKDKKSLWSQHLSSSPGDDVRVWWQPDSTAFLLQHIGVDKECKLFVVRVGGDAIQGVVVPADKLRDVKAIVGDTIVWDKEGSIQCEAETKTGKKRLRIERSGQAVDGVSGTDLMPFEQAGKWGFKDAAGKTVVEPEYDRVGSFSNGLAPVNLGAEEQFFNPPIKTGGKWGYVDTLGKVVVPITLDYAQEFSDGLARVSDDHGTRYLDPNGRLAIDLGHVSQAGDFHEGVAPVYEDRSLAKKGWRTKFIDKKGLTVFAVDGYAEEFHGGLAVLIVLQEKINPKISNERKLYGYIDRSGKAAIPPRFAEALAFHEGLAAVRPTKTTVYGMGDTWGYIDNSGKYVIEPKFNEAHPFRSGVARVHVGGALQTPCATIPFWEGGEWQLIDRTGKVLKRSAEWLEYDPVADLNAQIERFNKDRPGHMGITPIDQRVARIEYVNEQDIIRCRDQKGSVVLTLKRKQDGRFAGAIEVPFHEIPRPEGHSWGHAIAEFSLPNETLKQDATLPPPKEPAIEARFTAKVEWVEMEGKRKTDAVPIGVDPRWLVGIEILSVDTPEKPFDKNGKVVLLIHSPARLFAGEEKVSGKTYLFKVFGKTRNGSPVFSSAQAEEKRTSVPQLKPFTLVLPDGRTAVIAPKPEAFKSLKSIDAFQEQAAETVKKAIAKAPLTKIENVVFMVITGSRGTGQRDIWLEQKIGDYASVEIAGETIPAAGKIVAERTDASASGPPASSSATEPVWLPVRADSADYQKLAGPELVLIGRIEVSARKQPTRVAIDNPWLPVADLSDFQEPFDKLLNRRPLPQIHRTEILIKAKLKRDRSQGKRPVVVVGWVRELRSDEPDWQMPWPVNLPLLPPERELFSIPMIVTCKATKAADSTLGHSGVHHARQRFKVMEVFHGDAKVGEELDLRYSYLEPGMGFAWSGRDVKPGERVIWVVNGSGDGIHGYGAVADTPHNRQLSRDLAARVKAAPPQTRCDLLDLDLSKAQITANQPSDVADVFELPPGEKTWQVRKDVKVVYSGPDGEIYFVPEKKVYYLRRDLYGPTGTASHYYFGPFEKDPSLVPNQPPSAQPGNASGNLTDPSRGLSSEGLLAKAAEALKAVQTRVLTWAPHPSGLIQ